MNSALPSQMDLMEWASLTSSTTTWLIRTSSTSSPTPPQPRPFTPRDRTTITEETEARSAMIHILIRTVPHSFEECNREESKVRLLPFFMCAALPRRARAPTVWSPTRRLSTSCSSRWLWATLSPQLRRDHCPTGSGQPVLKLRTSAQSSSRCTIAPNYL